VNPRTGQQIAFVRVALATRNIYNEFGRHERRKADDGEGEAGNPLGIPAVATSRSSGLEVTSRQLKSSSWMLPQTVRSVDARRRQERKSQLAPDGGISCFRPIGPIISNLTCWRMGRSLSSSPPGQQHDAVWSKQ